MGSNCFIGATSGQNISKYPGNCSLPDSILHFQITIRFCFVCQVPSLCPPVPPAVSHLPLLQSPLGPLHPRRMLLLLRRLPCQAAPPRLGPDSPLGPWHRLPIGKVHHGPSDLPARGEVAKWPHGKRAGVVREVERWGSDKAERRGDRERVGVTKEREREGKEESRTDGQTAGQMRAWGAGGSGRQASWEHRLAQLQERAGGESGSRAVPCGTCSCSAGASVNTSHALDRGSFGSCTSSPWKGDSRPGRNLGTPHRVWLPAGLGDVRKQ